MKKSAAGAGKKVGAPDLGRRRALTALGVALLAGGAALAWGSGLFGGSAKATEVKVFKSPYCGCCDQWARHLRDNGFRVSVTAVDDIERIKAANGVTDELASCHTALVEGYVIEGHVPADLIRRLLTERPDAIGLAVPGMPSSSPGMDQPTGERYDVVLFGKNLSRIYARR